MTAPRRSPGSTEPGQRPDPKPLTARYAVVFVMAFVTAIVAGGLFRVATSWIPLAVLTGNAAFVESWRFYDRLVA